MVKLLEIIEIRKVIELKDIPEIALIFCFFELLSLEAYWLPLAEKTVG
ncbi:hypothetical protein IPdc08_00253 [archaeon]|nr:hypothetical protein IPdc08_00253 [archaeon]